MSLNIPLLIAGLVFSAVGFVYFSYGRKQAEVKLIATGVALMAYAYFVDSLAWSIGIGLVLSALPFVFKWW